MNTYKTLTLLSRLIIPVFLLFSSVQAQATSCFPSPKSACSGVNSNLFAVSHAFGSTDDNVIFRITIPGWSPGTGWTGDTNGFFYQVNTLQNGVISHSQYFVPFNGMHIGLDQLPKIPDFHMYPTIEDVDSNTSIQVKACSSNYQGSSTIPNCTQLFWTDTYTSLPTPDIIDSPPIKSYTTAYTLDKNSLEVADNGLFSASAILEIDPSFTQEQLDFLYNHTVFFQQNGDVYSNDIHNQGIGVLVFDEATYLGIKDQLHHTRYGNGNSIAKASAPSKRLFFYATNLASSNAKIGISTIYDQSDDCTGYITGNGSNNTACGTPFTGTPEFAVYMTLTATAWKPTANSGANIQAGSQRTRSIQLGVQTASNDLNAYCRNILNPLVIYPEDDQTPAFRPPNYVISNNDWSNNFPLGLY